jgi:hypothetical protein
MAANARDVPYQSLIKVWLQEKLQGSCYLRFAPGSISVQNNAEITAVSSRPRKRQRAAFIFSRTSA